MGQIPGFASLPELDDDEFKEEEFWDSRFPDYRRTFAFRPLTVARALDSASKAQEIIRTHLTGDGNGTAPLPLLLPGGKPAELNPPLVQELCDLMAQSREEIPFLEWVLMAHKWRRDGYWKVRNFAQSVTLGNGRGGEDTGSGSDGSPSPPAAAPE